MVDRNTEMSDHFIRAGAGTGLVLANLGALIPGLLPFLALTAAVAAVLVAPFAILGLAVVLMAASFYLASRVVRRARRREQAAAARGLGSRAPAGTCAGAGTSSVVRAAHVHKELPMVPNDNPDRDAARRRVEPLAAARAWWLRLCLREDLAGAANRRLMGSPRSTEGHRRRRPALEDLIYADAMARQLEEIRSLPEAAS